MKKPIVYHYCLLRQKGNLDLQYIHGSCELNLPVCTHADYSALIDDLAKSCGCERDELAVISLSRL